VVRATVGYGAVGFVLLQMAEIALPAFLPGPRADAALRILVVAFLLLFPVVVAMAWVYEMTPRGLRAMTELDVEAGRAPVARMLPRVAFLAFAVLVAGATGLWWYRTDTAAVGADLPTRERATPFVAASTTDASGPIRSLAVLPLQDFSSDGSGQAYFAAGLHETLISQLSQLGTVRVMSRTSVEGYAREGKSMPQVGDELGVDAVVEGSVLRADDRVRITVQLIHAASDTHLWASDYERDLQDVIALQREVAEAIAGEIGVQVEAASGEVGDMRVAEGAPASLGSSESATEAVGPGASTPDVVEDVSVARPPSAPAMPEVHDAVFRGRFALSTEGGGDAERHFLDALAMDSTFVPALAGLAGTYLMRGLEAEEEDAAVELRKAREVAAEAARRDPASMEAREVLASADEALMELDGAGVDAPPLSFGTVTEIGRVIQAAMGGKRDGSRSALRELRAVRRLDAAGHPEEARDRAVAAVVRYSEESGLWDEAERLAVSQGDWRDVLRLRQEREEAGVRPPGPDADALEAALREDGVEGYWTWKAEELDARQAAGSPVSPVDRASVAAALGDGDGAIALLDEAREIRDPRLLSLRTDPVWDALRQDRRFQVLLRSLARD
jgi:TolB-like protein